MTKISSSAVYACVVLFILVRVGCAQVCLKCRCCKQLHHRKCTSTGQCYYGCIYGYHGRNCNYKCSSQNCLSCHQYIGNICLECKSGYYLYNYNCYDCKSNCKSCDFIRRCQSCYDGYWGNTCQQKCKGKCVSCRQDGYCLSCEPGYTGSTCDKCAIGRFGKTCQYECSKDCTNGHCDVENAICRCNSNYKGETCDQCANGRFGKNCQYLCSRDCINGHCDEVNAICRCNLNYKGKTCDQCSSGRFGNKCEQSCSLGCNFGNCTRYTGLCSCKFGWSGQRCNTSLVGGVGGGAVAFAGIVVIGLVLLRRRENSSKNKSKPKKQEPENCSALYATVNEGRAKEDTNTVHSVTITENPNYQSPPPKSSGKNKRHIMTEENLEIEEDISAREITVMFEANGGIYYNNAKEVSKFKLTVADLPEYAQYIGIRDLEEEFQRIPYGLIKPYGVSQTKFNMQRNRYKGIYPYDDTRVVVRGGDTDYINASYVDGFRKRNAYIAALGPMAKQLGDFGQFWRMIWQQKVEKIVMVTNLVEGEKTKCEQYWPDHCQSKLYGDVEVVCKVEKLYADFIWRQFTFSKRKQNSEERILHHLQFTAWPDKDIPDNVTSIIEFRQRVNALQSTLDGPVIVHCSAGVGRTGTYIALDILTKEGEAEGAIDIPGCVLNMRQSRPSMIQTLSQYKYLHQALVQSLTLNCSLIKREHFVEYMNMMSSKQEIQKLFEKMQFNQEQKSDQEQQATENNRLLTKKNRKHADIPGDSNRPRLYLFLNPGESDYINAIYINSFKTKNRFLVAQTPLPDTVSDFIALAVQENCSCIVSLEAQGIGLYVPGDNISMQKGVISILSTRDQSTRHFVKRMLHFELDRKTKVVIPHYEYLNWDRNLNTPRSAEYFVAFIKEVEDASKSLIMNGPILVHCMNGAGKSGLFCVVSTLLETLIEDNEVSVVNAVMKVRAKRTLSIPNKEQFYFCYECVLQSLNAKDDAVYYNTSGDIKRT
ncbi:receptor-type tyrosine-protein phosphatase epsilon-like isoform X2 [Mya arenaria]|uniref:receptor-type tyrosine-protein phosphatase epsilon-like isoform X2 n=1 Tax=Mya arenaria TaxID=6604 RepID=UPI0022E4D67E|nr:receptor-type tyrosine-protein phosphatase epsilon-like isoform X2 [Mya arenaria]